MIDFAGIVQFVGGFYLLISAIVAKGKLFRNEYLKISREKYVKVLRIFSAVSGVALILTNALKFGGVFAPKSALDVIGSILGIGTLAAMMIYIVAVTGRQPISGSEPNKEEDPFHAAFVFDDEDNAKK